VKNESRFSAAESTPFYSEFNADSKYVILFSIFFWTKNDPINTCPLTLHFFSLCLQAQQLLLSIFDRKISIAEMKELRIAG
jgi:hypothetical protein